MKRFYFYFLFSFLFVFLFNINPAHADWKNFNYTRLPTGATPENPITISITPDDCPKEVGGVTRYCFTNDYGGDNSCDSPILIGNGSTAEYSGSMTEVLHEWTNLFCCNDADCTAAYDYSGDLDGSDSFTPSAYVPPPAGSSDSSEIGSFEFILEALGNFLVLGVLIGLVFIITLMFIS